eukprot:scaffold1098_cov417-Prasinococcus_capsulatus_cf.AAC.6
MGRGSGKPLARPGHDTVERATCEPTCTVQVHVPVQGPGAGPGGRAWEPPARLSGGEERHGLAGGPAQGAASAAAVPAKTVAASAEPSARGRPWRATARCGTSLTGCKGSAPAPTDCAANAGSLWHCATWASALAARRTIGASRGLASTMSARARVMLCLDAREVAGCDCPIVRSAGASALGHSG